MSKFSKSTRSKRSTSNPLQPATTKKRNVHVTKSGTPLKLNTTLISRFKSRRDEKARKRAEYLATLPKSRVKRTIHRLHPKRLAKYWFSRDGLIMAIKLTGLGIFVGGVAVLLVFAYFRRDLPNIKDLTSTNQGGSVRYYDRTGQTLLFEDFDSFKRVPVEDKDISQNMKDATVAIEDKDFFKHGGFNLRGIIRAVINNARGGSTQGGSTITQQFVKISVPQFQKEHTITRKIKELILAVEVEQNYSKKEILAGYLNLAPYGGLEVGVQAASQTYFHKQAKDLTVAESAFLAAIPKSPNAFSPYSTEFDKDSLINRQHYIIDLMLSQGYITKDEAKSAKAADILASVQPRTSKYTDIKAPYFVLAARDELMKTYTSSVVERGGWKVTTTLDMEKQQLAEESVANGMAQVRRQGGDVAAFVAEDVKTGQIVALVGGPDFNNETFGQNNYAQTRIPPGSSFKPYDYISLMENSTNAGAGSVLYDTLGAVDGYPCTNKALPPNGNCLWDFSRTFSGPLTLRYALGGSRNVPAVKAMAIAGVDKTITIAQKLGLRSGYKCFSDEQLTQEAKCYTASAIGDGAYLKLDEHVNGYSSISRNGMYLPRTYILKIEDSNNKTLKEWKQPAGEQVVRQDSAYIMADMMSDPRASYFSNPKPQTFKNWKFSLKTGTTNDAKDGLLIGFSTQYAAGVWVGYHDHSHAMSGGMEQMTLPIWKNWMTKVHDPLTPVERIKPSGVQTLPAYVIRSHVGYGSVEPSPTNDLYPSWYIQPKKTTGNKTVDTVSNKLATDCTPELAKKIVNNADSNVFSIDKFVGTGGTTDEKDDVHKCDDPKPTITISAPADCDGSCTFSAIVTAGNHALQTVNFLANGQILPGGSFTVSDSGTVTYNYSGTLEGSQTITAQVIDEVLYDASSQATVSFTAAVALEITSAKYSGTNTKFTWSGGAEPVSIFKVVGSTFLCSGNNSCTFPGTTAPNGTQVYAKDSNGTSSAYFNVSN